MVTTSRTAKTALRVIKGGAVHDAAGLRGEAREQSQSWTRADPTEELVERVTWNRWLVTLPDSEDVHEVRLERDHGALVGDCVIHETGERCPARKYNDDEEPCAHLCTLRKALVLNDEADDGGRDVDGDVLDSRRLGARGAGHVGVSDRCRNLYASH